MSNELDELKADLIAILNGGPETVTADEAIALARFSDAPHAVSRRPGFSRATRRGRWVTAISFAVVIGLLAGYAVTGGHSAGSGPHQHHSLAPTAGGGPESLLSRPLHFPSLGPGGSCPASPGTTFNNSFFGGIALGSGRVRVLLADSGDILHGRVNVVPYTSVPGWFAIQTLWFSLPGYNGPFVVHAKRLGEASSTIEVQPSGEGLTPGSGPLVVPAGPTANTKDGYRTMPGSTWITAPGCYAWQVDGLNFSEIIVFDALRSQGR